MTLARAPMERKPFPPRSCAVCSRSFAPARMGASVCSPKCAARVPVLERQSRRVRLAEMKPLGHWMKLAQQAFNAWIRERDKGRRCISCEDALVGRQGSRGGQYDAGHYLTVGARPELRFDERNVHKQCKQCNQHLHGNIALFRIGLGRRYGFDVVEALEGPHEPKRYRAEDLKAITADYRARLRALNKGHEHG